MTTAEWSAPDYEEIRRLGSGATGRVVLARHRGTGGLCAVKYLGERFVGDPAFVERFRREAALLASVRDPHVVRLYDYIEAPPAGVAIVMEAVEGPTLRALLAQQGPRTPEAALAVLRGSLLGLAAAHSLGVVHRDYKPENVLVDASGESKLADFGIAAPVGGGTEATGTPVYMAPEQWNGWPAAPATDMYAASAVFFETLTGRRPYVSDTLEGLRLQHESAPLPLDAVPPVLQPMLERGLAKYPQNRHADATEFLAELERVATAGYGPGWLERGVRDLAVVAGAMAAAVPLLAVATGAAGAGGVGLTGAAGGGAGAGLGGAAGGSGAAGAAGAHTAAAAAQAAQAAHVAATQSAAQLGAAVTQASQGAVQGAAQGLAGNAAHAVGQGAAEGGAHLAGQQGLGASANGWGQTAHHVGTAGKQGVRAGRHGFKLMSAKGAVVAASVVGVAAAGTAVAVTSSGGSGGGGTAQQQVANRTDAAFKLAGNGDFPGLCDYIAPLDQQAMSAFGGCKQMMQIGSGFLTFGGLSGTDQQAIAAMKTITVDPAKVIVNGDHATVPVSALRGSGVAVFLQGQGNQESIPWVRIGGTWYLSEGDDSGGPTLPTGIPTFGLPNPADSQTTDNSVVSPSDTGSASGTAAAVDVCGLVTTSQVGGATGMQDPTVAGPVSGPEPNGCRWTDPAGNAVQAWVGPGDKSAFEQAAATGSPVPGLGDEAYSTGGEIFALSGDQEVVVAVTGNAGTGLTDDAGMAMAQAVIDALPGS